MIFSAYVTNLGKYNEGALIGEWVDFPCSQTDFEKALDRIGVSDKINENGQFYEEYFFTDYDYPIVNCDFGEYESYKHLNEVAEKLDDLEDDELEIINAYFKEIGDDLEGAINSIDNSMYFPDCNDMCDCAYFYVDDICGGPENLDKNTLEQFFDYEAFGRAMRFDGHFVETDDGYIEFF